MFLAAVVRAREVFFAAVAACILIGRSAALMAWRRALLAPLAAMLLWSAGSVGAYACNWNLTFSAIGVAQPLDTTSCDSIILDYPVQADEWGGLHRIQGTDALNVYGVGANDATGVPEADNVTGINGGVYEFVYDYVTGVFQVKLVTPPSTSPDSLKLYSYVGPSMPSNAFATTENNFTMTVNLPPTVTGVSPVSGPTAGGATVIITGTGFATANPTGAVKFGATDATYTINSNTQITATSPANAAGTYDVTVTTAGGTSATSASDRYTYVAVPTVTSVGPNLGPTAGGATITITGTGFAFANSTGAVKFGATNASYTINSNTQITAISPANSSGTYDVTVTTSGGTSATTAADQYTYVAAPTVTSVSPGAGPTSGGTTVIITGTGFSTAAGVGAVKFGATAATYTINSNTQITATSPASSAGTYDVTVTTPGGTSATNGGDQFTFVAPPTVTSLSAISGPLGGGTVVTITGTGFSGATAVLFGGDVATSFTVNSSTSITATSPAGSAGTVDVRVTTIGGASATSAADRFTYVPAPTVTSITPTAGPTGSGTMVVITGTGFAAAAGTGAVKFGGLNAPLYTINSATSITAMAPAGTGTVDVTVTTPGGTSATSAADQYTYVPAPAVTGVSPNVGPTGGGTTVVIAGTDFSGASAVTFGGTAATGFTIDSATSITATAPAQVGGTVDVRVTTVGGTSATSASDQYTYVPQPSISGLAPSSGSDAGGATVTIAGSGLAAVTSISFGGTPATSFTVDSDTQITATAPAGVGIVDVVATSAGGTSANTAADDFTYLSIAGAPTAVSAVAGDTTAAVSFTAPASDGNAVITGYTVTASPGGATASGLSTTLTVGGLTNGQDYSFTVTATNSEGPSPASAPSNIVTPKGPQTITFANPNVQVYGTAPDLGVLGGGATSTSGLPVTFTSNTTNTCTISPTGSLSFVRSGACSINADQVGDAAYLPAAQVVQVFLVSPVAPGEPTNVVATAGDGEVTVTFSAPTNDGGVPVSAYYVTPNPLDVPAVQNFGGGPVVVQGLLNGRAYTFTVTAETAAGTGNASMPSNSVTPQASQTITFADPGPQSFGTTPILSASSDAGLMPVFTSSTPAVCTVSSTGQLAFVSGGTCTISADQPGDAAHLPAVQVTRSFVVHAVLPSAPGITGATISGTTAEISFTAPVSEGGSPITAYTVTAAPGGAQATGPGSPLTLGGLTAGETYTFTVTADNSAGTGQASAPSNAVTAGTSQTITFPDPGLLLVGGSATLTATASSGLPVSYSTTTPAICTVTTSGALSLLAAGACVVEVNQPGDSTYNPAPMVSLSLTVWPGSVTLTPAAGALPDAMAGEDYSETVVASGQTGAVTYAATGTLPAGLTVGASSGDISGSVDVGAEGDYSFSITATDTSGNAGSASYTLKVLVRAVTVENKAVTVPAGSTPVPVNLTTGATGGPFSGGAVVGVEPPEAGTATITGADVAAIDTTYDALYLRFTPNPQYTGVARVTYSLTSTQGESAQGIVAYTLAADLGAVAQDIQPISDGFISTRSGLLAGAVDTPGLQDRRSAGNATLPGTVSVTPSGNSMTMNFAASTLAATAASNAAESLVVETVDEGGLNFWIDGTATLHFRNDSVGDHWGSLALASVGADMLLTDDLLVGVALHADWMDDVTGTSRVAGTGLLVGPYVSAELVEGVFLDASAYYGQSWNSITSGLFSGTFDTQRLLAKASLTGQWQLSDQLTLQPAANLFYLHESAGAYTVSDGLGNTASIASFALDQLRASIGATLRYSIDVDGNLVITPFLGVELGLSVTNGTSGYFGRLSTGFDVTGLGAWTLGLGFEAGLENGDIQSVSVTGRARANF
jgi:hypothetical protein